MPGGNRQGPMGEGPQTGRAAGFCSGSDTPGYMSDQGGFGRGHRFRSGGGGGRRRGFGRGRGFVGAQPFAGTSSQTAMPIEPQLQKQVNELQEELSALRQLLEEMRSPRGNPAGDTAR